MQNTASPAPTGRPSSTAPVAPGKPMCARACAANALLRTTMKKPIKPAASSHQGSADQRIAHERRRQNLPPIVLVAKRYRVHTHQMLRMYSSPCGVCTTWTAVPYR